MMTKETLDRLVDLVGQASRLPDATGAEPLAVIGNAQKVESLARFFPPPRIRREVLLLEASSFIDYVNRFKTGNTLIFANVTETGASFTAMLDYHGAAPELKPAYCEHVAKFGAIPTPEWKIWLGANRKPMDQVTFATFLEDNMTLFVQPAGADLLELVRSLHGHRNARFNTALRLDNGAYSVSYDEDIVVKGTNTTKSGDMELPPTIKAGMAVFQGADAYEIPARLKTRVDDRRLVLFYETIALHQIIRESILLLVKQIADKTDLIPLLGNP
ncbi:MAG: DUF2303 family protein [Bryobacteraceae bacterium]